MNAPDRRESSVLGSDSHWIPRSLIVNTPAEHAALRDAIAGSDYFKSSLSRARKLGLRSVSLLLQGEVGTGKQLFALALHSNSNRADRPFLALRCANLAADSLETDFLLAVDGGTVFLDEVGESPLDVQVKLQGLLPPVTKTSRRTVEWAAAPHQRLCDVRFIAGTSCNLEAGVRDGWFRDDLYAAVSTITFVLPPLRTRRNRIVGLARSLLKEINDDRAAANPGAVRQVLSAAAQALLPQYRWPGNVRQLYAVLLTAAALAEDRVIDRADLESAWAECSHYSELGCADTCPSLQNGRDLEEHLDCMRREFVRRALHSAGGDVGQAATRLGITRSALVEMLQRWD